MTRAQRLELLKQIEKDIHVCSLESTLLDDAKSCAIHSVIEELEQELFINKPCISKDVCEYDKNVTLNKIRAEINSPNRGTCDYFVIDRIEEIINEYTAESDIEKRKECPHKPCINHEDLRRMGWVPLCVLQGKKGQSRYSTFRL